LKMPQGRLNGTWGRLKMARGRLNGTWGKIGDVRFPKEDVLVSIDARPVGKFPSERAEIAGEHDPAAVGQRHQG
jgi:hypothetical protein